LSAGPDWPVRHCNRGKDHAMTTAEMTEQTTITASRAVLALHNLAAKEDSRPLLAHV
jgi:hypothetical protein